MLFVVSSPVYSLTAHSYQLSLQLGFLCSCISVRIPRSDNTQHIEQKSLRSTQNGLFNPRIPASTAHSAQSTNSNLYKPPIMPTNNQDAEPLSSHQDVFRAVLPALAPLPVRPTPYMGSAPHAHCSRSSLPPQTMICSTCAGTDFCTVDGLERNHRLRELNGAEARNGKRICQIRY